MRISANINSGWYFLRRDVSGEVALSVGEAVQLPHTWNAKDGQDGGNDYYRGKCWYAKKLTTPRLTDGTELWIEFRGAAITAEVFLNGKKLHRHEGGFSTFRANLTPALKPREKKTF